MRGGSFFALEMHLERLAKCAGATGITLPPLGTIRAALESVRHVATVDGRNPTDTGGESRIRISCRSDGMSTVVSIPMRAASGDGHPRPAAVVIERTALVMAGSPLAGLKTNDYAHGVGVLASHPEADEVIVLNQHGDVCGAVHANVFLSNGDRLITPPLSSGCRDGVTRALLLERLAASGIRAEERRIPESELSITPYRGPVGFLCSTGRGVQPIGSIDGDPVPTDDPMITAAISVFADLRDDPAMWS